MKSELQENKDSGDILFDHADVQDASVFESQRNGKGSVVSFLGVVWKAIKRKRFILAVALFVPVVTLFALRQYGYFVPDTILLFLKSNPVIAPIVFIVIYAVMVICLMPTLPLNLGAGLIWGPYWGGALAVIGAGTGSACAFLIARYLASDYFNKKFSHSAWIWLRGEIQHNDWKAVAFTRVNPVFPFGPSSYFFGLTQIKFYRYFISTILFISPLAVMFAAIGSSINGAVLEGGSYILVRNVAIASACVTLFIALRVISKRKKKKNSSDFAQRD